MAMSVRPTPKWNYEKGRSGLPIPCFWQGKDRLGRISYVTFEVVKKLSRSKKITTKETKVVIEASRQAFKTMRHFSFSKTV